MRLRALGLVVAAGVVALFPANLEAQKRSRDVIKREEIVATVTKDVDLYEAIKRMRPHFYENRARTFGGGMINPIRVYIDRNEQPGVEFLKGTLAWDVEEARYLSPSEAEGRFGGKANGGAIVLKLVKVRIDTTTKVPPTDTLTPD